LKTLNKAVKGNTMVIEIPWTWMKEQASAAGKAVDVVRVTVQDKKVMAAAAKTVHAETVKTAQGIWAFASNLF
jgi:hypothetical protein